MLLFQFYSWNNHSERLNDLPNFSKLVGRRVRIIEVFLTSHCASGPQEQVLSTQPRCAVSTHPPPPILLKMSQVQWQLCCLSRALHDPPALHSISSLDSPSSPTPTPETVDSPLAWPARPGACWPSGCLPARLQLLQLKLQRPATWPLEAAKSSALDGFSTVALCGTGKGGLKHITSSLKSKEIRVSNGEKLTQCSSSTLSPVPCLTHSRHLNIWRHRTQQAKTCSCH